MADNNENKNSLKKTKQREIIRDIMRKSRCPLSAREIYEKAIRYTEINLSTVYRTLNIMNLKGMICKSPEGDGRMVYQLQEGRHGHFITCDVCHDVVFIDSCPIEELSELISRETGYVVTGHSLMFTGLCPRCACKDKDK